MPKLGYSVLVEKLYVRHTTLGATFLGKVQLWLYKKMLENLPLESRAAGKVSCEIWSLLGCGGFLSTFGGKMN